MLRSFEDFDIVEKKIDRKIIGKVKKK